MKGYQAAQLLIELGTKFEIQKRNIIVTGDVGLTTWGKLDYMKKCGYTITRRDK